jgi:ligand-binding SRPBCC domain-containing protein
VTLERGAGEGFRLTAEHRLAAPLDHVFAFFSEPVNLERITPPWLRFRIEEAPPSLQTGALIDYRLRLHGIPLGWRTEITAWEPPHRFVDEQVRGPFRRWVHEHTFASEGGSTVVRDVVQYTMLLAPIAQRIVVGRDLRAIFAYRHRMVAALLGDTGLTPP